MEKRLESLWKLRKIWISYIIYSIIIILIILDIARIGYVLFSATSLGIKPQNFENTYFSFEKQNSTLIFNYNISTNSENETYNAKYEGIDNDTLINILLIKESRGIFENINPNENMDNNQRSYSPNAENMAINISGNSINIWKNFTSTPKDFPDYFANIQIPLFRAIISKILYIIIFLTIASLVPIVIEEKEKKEEKKNYDYFIYLILTTLVLSLILTFTPLQKGDGDVSLEVDPSIAISAFFLTISIILIIWFKLRFINKIDNEPKQ